MTWTKVSDEFLDSPAVLRVGRSARLLLLEGRVWSNRHLTDGLIERPFLRRVTDSPEAEDDAAALVAAGLWEVTPDGWRDVGFLDDQQSRDEVLRLREQKRQRQARWRAKSDPESSDASRDLSVDASRDAAPSHPVPSHPAPKGGAGGHEHEPNARRALAALGVDVPTDELLRIAYAAGRDGDPWDGYRQVKHELQSFGGSIRDPAAVLRKRLGVVGAPS